MRAEIVSAGSASRPPATRILRASSGSIIDRRRGLQPNCRSRTSSPLRPCLSFPYTQPDRQLDCRRISPAHVPPWSTTPEIRDLVALRNDAAVPMVYFETRRLIPEKLPDRSPGAPGRGAVAVDLPQLRRSRLVAGEPDFCAHCPDPDCGSSPLNNRSTRKIPRDAHYPAADDDPAANRCCRPIARRAAQVERDLLKVQRELEYLEFAAASFCAMTAERRCGGYDHPSCGGVNRSKVTLPSETLATASANHNRLTLPECMSELITET